MHTIILYMYNKVQQKFFKSPNGKESFQFPIQYNETSSRATTARHH